MGPFCHPAPALSSGAKLWTDAVRPIAQFADLAEPARPQQPQRAMSGVDHDQADDAGVADRHTAQPHASREAIPGSAIAEPIDRDQRKQRDDPEGNPEPPPMASEPI